jgi:PleD family two-component response regulator
MSFDPSAYPLLNWAFGGVGIAIVGYVLNLMKNSLFPSKEKSDKQQDLRQHTEQNVNLNIYNTSQGDEKVDSMAAAKPEDDEVKKNTTKILFIDDEIRFKVVKILQRAGWIHTKLIKDAESLDQLEIKEAKIIFVDIQGVGLELNFKEEGLGLASALKNKYPEKRIIIYSAEQKGDRFHQALREVDDFLQKDADPYQFQRIVEDFA